MSRKRPCGCWGIDAQVVDVRTMVPLDVNTLCASVSRTGRCVMMHVATRFTGYGAELVRDGPGGVLLEFRITDSARHRVGHAVSACFRMGVPPRSGANRRGGEGGDGGGMNRYRFQVAGPGRGHGRSRDRRLAGQGR